MDPTPGREGRGEPDRAPAPGPGVDPESGAAAESAPEFDPAEILARFGADVIVVGGPDDDQVRWVSPSVERVLGWRPGDWVGKGAFGFVHPDDLAAITDDLSRAPGASATTNEFRVRAADGSYRCMHAHAHELRGPDGELQARVAVLHDVSATVAKRERSRRAERASLLESAESGRRFRILAEHASDVVFETDPSGVIVWASPSTEAVLGRSPASIIGFPASDLSVPDDSSAVEEAPELARPSGEPAERFTEVRRRFVTAGGALRWMDVRWRPVIDDQGEVATVVVALRDCHAEVVAQRAVRTMSASSAVLATATAEYALLAEMCRVAVESGGYVFAWYGRRQDDDERHVAKAAAHGDDDGYLDGIEVRWADVTAGHGPTGTAIRTGATVVVADIASDAGFAPWADSAAVRGFHSMVSLPVVVNGAVDGAFGVYAAEVDAFDAASVAMLEDLAVQLGLGLTRLRDLAALSQAIADQEAMTVDLARHRSERAEVTRIMGSVRAGPTLAETAARLCTTIVGVDRVDAAGLFLRNGGGQTVPLALAGADVPGLVVGAPLTEVQLGAVVDLAVDGPWVLDLSNDASEELLSAPLLAGVRAAGLTALAFAGLDLGADLECVLVAGAKGVDGAIELARRLGMLDELAALAGTVVGGQVDAHVRGGALRSIVRQILANGTFHPVFQPVVDLRTREVVGYEALTRFDDGRPPQARFADAHDVGLGPDLEAACAMAAVEAAHRLPEGLWLSVNFSPDAIVLGLAAEVLAGADRPTVVEITEHAVISSYADVREALAQCPGTRVSVDDAGAGYASLRHILELGPDIVKLDLGLVRNVDTDRVRQGLAAGLSHFADLTDTVLLAEGVETEAEAARLVALGVRYAQGYLFGRPLPVDELPGVTPALV